MGAGLSRGKMLPILVIQALSEYTRSESKPPVTAALILVNVLFYLRWPPLLDRALPDINQVWFNPYLVVKVRSFSPFLLPVRSSVCFVLRRYEFRSIALSPVILSLVCCIDFALFLGAERRPQTIFPVAAVSHGGVAPRLQHDVPSVERNSTGDLHGEH